MMLSEPQRLHPYTVLFDAVATARAFVVPALFGGVSAGGGEVESVLTWTLALLSVPAILLAVARYFSFRYRLTGDELIIDSGVLSRQRRVIPLARIQNIDVRESPLQRLCGVVELRVETAGSGETEAALRVLDRAHAESLRVALLAGRRAALVGGGVGVQTEETEPVRELARLSTQDLIVAGATASEAGIVAAALGGALQVLDDLRIDVPDFLPDPERIAELSGGDIVVAVAGIVLAVLLIGWLSSILGALITYHGFTLEQTSSELRKRYGLLSRRESVVPLERVQAVRVEESWIRRPFRLAALKVETAGGAPQERRRGGAEAFLPIARAADVQRLVEAVLGGLDYDGLVFLPAHPRARRRAFVRYTIVFGLAAVALTFVVEPRWLPFLPVLPVAWLAAGRYYRNLGYALAPGFVVTRAGLLDRITWIVPDRRIQTVHLVQSPFQRRHGLADVVVDTAAGGLLREAAAKDIAYPDALALLREVAERTAFASGATRAADPGKKRGAPTEGIRGRSGGSSAGGGQNRDS